MNAASTNLDGKNNHVAMGSAPQADNIIWKVEFSAIEISSIP